MNNRSTLSVSILILSGLSRLYPKLLAASVLLAVYTLLAGNLSANPANPASGPSVVPSASYHRGGAPSGMLPGNTAAARWFSRPYVSAVRPANGAKEVPLDMSVSVDLMFPGASAIDGSTVNPINVRLYVVEGSRKKLVSGTAVNASAAGDAITLSASLAPLTEYEFEITDKVTDMDGNPLMPFTSRFTTASTVPETLSGLEGVAFSAQTLVTSDFGKDGFTSLVIGPDHRLYATTSGGKIARWDIAPDGSLQNQVIISPFSNERRLVIGIHFDPAATDTKLIAWITHSSSSFEGASDWSSCIAKVDLSNPASPQCTTYITNLPRSFRDHSINSIDFGPDGALYVTMGSNTAMGLTSRSWGDRPERLLSAAVLRLDIKKAEQHALPLDVKTPDGGGTYNPYAKDAPLTLYATGIRNAYDLVWHSNGRLYVPTNGSAAGGNTPALTSGTVWSNGKAYTGPDIPALMDVRDTQNDYLYCVEKGGYYGHPNPLRHEYILNGGNPEAGEDPAEILWSSKGITYGYPTGTPVEPNFRYWSYDFGKNISPNGVIEYKSNAFGGKLQGRLMVCRFSGGDDIIMLEPSKTNRGIASAVEGIMVPGLRRPYANPLDIVEDERTGNLYISEYFEGNGSGIPQITLLKASVPAGAEVPKGEDTVRLTVYPNPASTSGVTVSVLGLVALEEVAVTVLDITGRGIQTTNITADAQGTANTQVAVAQSLSGGIYFIKAACASGVVKYQRLLVQ